MFIDKEEVKDLDSLLKKLESGSTYMMWSFPADGGKKVFKEEIIKDPYRVKAAKIIRILVKILHLSQSPESLEDSLKVELLFQEFDKVLNDGII